MKRIAAVIAGVVTLAASTQSWGAGGIAGSVHDFSKTNSATYGSWNTRNGICSACHAAHHTDDGQLVPLWIHATTTATFTPYSNPNTMNAVVGQPDGVSLACLSCHDGTLGINTQITGGGAGSNVNSGGAAVIIDPSAQIGPDLHTTHPISFVYDSALATADGELEDPTTYAIGDPKTRLTQQTAPVPTNWTGTSLTGKTIKQAMLFDDKMQCGSCHDVHKMDGSAPSSGILLRISGSDITGRGSLVCRTCHVK